MFHILPPCHSIIILVFNMRALLGKKRAFVTSDISQRVKPQHKPGQGALPTLGKCPFPIPWKRRETEQGFSSLAQILFCRELFNLLSDGFSPWAQFSSWMLRLSPSTAPAVELYSSQEKSLEKGKAALLASCLVFHILSKPSVKLSLGPAHSRPPILTDHAII